VTPGDRWVGPHPAGRFRTFVVGLTLPLHCDKWTGALRRRFFHHRQGLTLPTLPRLDSPPQIPTDGPLCLAPIEPRTVDYLTAEQTYLVLPIPLRG